MTAQLWTTTPTSGDDFLIGGAGASTIDGGDGDDYISGDEITPFTTGTNNSLMNPFNIDNPAKWTSDENPFVTSALTPHTSLYVAADAGQKQYASVTIGAGDAITIDIDFGNHIIGGSTDTVVLLLDSNGNVVASNDDNPNYPADPGSQSGLDSYLTYTNTTGSTQLFTIVFEEFDSSDGNVFEGGETFVANISVNGHAATGTAGAGNDVLSGGAGNDTLAGEGGNDTLSGGDGNDDLYGGSGNDTLDGGTGFDTAWYNDATSGVTVDLNKTVAQNTGGAGIDTLTSIESLVGSTYGDTLAGDDNFNTIHGGAGDDTIYGNGGGDSLFGEDGNDILRGGAGNDYLYADANYYSGGFVNSLVGGTGDDYLASGYGDDYLEGDDGNDTFYDTGGDDRIAGGAGTDLLQYWGIGSGVTVDLSITTPQNTGGAGTDTITGIENLTGSSGNDTLTGTSGNNIIMGYYGNDVINGGAGNDTLYGGLGDDTINGGGGVDTVSYADPYNPPSTGVTVDLAVTSAQDTVGAGIDTISNIENLVGSVYDDTLSGNGLNNNIDGGTGNDVINGRGGNDVLSGGDGDDTLNGGAGDDVLGGGAGNNTASYVGAASGVTVNIALNGPQNTGGAGNDTLNNIQNLTGSGYGDTLIGAGGTNILDGRGGNDTLTGGNGADMFLFDVAPNSSTNHDNITDFQHASDKIELAHTVFGAAGPDGTLAAGAFYAGSAAHDADDRIIYDSTTGNIYYDADGNGSGAAVLFAHVTAGLTVTNSDFVIVG